MILERRLLKKNNFRVQKMGGSTFSSHDKSMKKKALHLSVIV
ncbi:hypothetical protein TPHV1_140059 [Treponema phagedenis]|uniref:Uncharacterized protein n=1 Tax=Treponema phagedenis TaxID=162 RepID=A0A0B7GWU3_TREPH|nr:hypothetical protein TPHV1_140059 [Treponema phagedenis]